MCCNSFRCTRRGGAHIVIATKIGSGKPLVGATLVVARSRHQPVFIPLCGIHMAMVIPAKSLPRNPIRGNPLHNCHTGEGPYPEGRVRRLAGVFPIPDISPSGKLFKSLRKRESIRGSRRRHGDIPANEFTQDDVPSSRGRSGCGVPLGGCGLWIPHSAVLHSE